MDAAAPTDTSEPKLAADFEEWWDRYGNKRERTPAERLYAHWREHGASADQLLTAADNYRADCHANSRIQKYPATFLAKAHPPWKDWLEAAPVVSAPAPKGALDRTFDALRETWAGLQEQQR